MAPRLAAMEWLSRFDRGGRIIAKELSGNGENRLAVREHVLEIRRAAAVRQTKSSQDQEQSQSPAPAAEIAAEPAWTVVPGKHVHIFNALPNYDVLAPVGFQSSPFAKARFLLRCGLVCQKSQAFHTLSGFWSTYHGISCSESGTVRGKSD